MRALRALETPAPLLELLQAAQRSVDVMPYRATVVGEYVEDFVAALAVPEVNFQKCRATPRIALVFQGQGSQYAGMARDWYEQCPVFRASIDSFIEQVHEPLSPKGMQIDGDRFRALLLDDNATDDIHQTVYAQPCLFAFCYAMQLSLRSHGVKADFSAGHSLGEWVAVAAAGMLPAQDAFSRVCQRARVMQGTAEGAMLVLFCSKAQVLQLLEEAGAALGLALVAQNGPNHCAAAGSEIAIAALRARAEGAGVTTRRARVQRAFHSPSLDPVLPHLRSEFAGISCRAGGAKVVSGIDGHVRDASAFDTDYWVRQAREAVNFEAVRQTLERVGATVVVDVGPDSVLEALWGQGSRFTILSAAKRGVSARISLADILSGLFRHGVEIDWLGQRVCAPLRCSPLRYPFDAKPLKDQYLRQRQTLPATTTNSLLELIWTAEEVQRFLCGRGLDTSRFSVAAALNVAAAMLEEMRLGGYRRIEPTEIHVPRHDWSESALRLRSTESAPPVIQLRMECQARGAGAKDWKIMVSGKAYRSGDEVLVN
jgi:acyl transferase domain-containing protein